MSRGVVLRRRLPSKFGSLPIYVTPEAGLRYWLRMSQVDPFLYNMVEELVQPGSVVWDVGANVGLFGLCAAALAGPSGYVVSIEPDLWLAHLVARSSRRISHSSSASAHVKVLCAAVSDSCGISELVIAERERASNHLVGASGSTQARAQRFTQPTVSVTLDSLLLHFPAPSVVKIDVETHETSVLRGAEKILNEIKPKILCEVHKQNSMDVTNLLHAAGYQLYGAQTQPHPPTKRAWFNTLAVPAIS